MSKKLPGQKLKIINIGIQTFAEDLKKQNVEVIHVDWRPPAGGDMEILELLDKLRKKSNTTK